MEGEWRRVINELTSAVSSSSSPSGEPESRTSEDRGRKINMWLLEEERKAEKGAWKCMEGVTRFSFKGMAVVFELNCVSLGWGLIMILPGARSLAHGDECVLSSWVEKCSVYLTDIVITSTHTHDFCVFRVWDIQMFSVSQLEKNGHTAK